MSSVSCSIIHVPVPWPFSRPMFHSYAPCSMLRFHVPCSTRHDSCSCSMHSSHAPWFLRHVSCSTLHDLFSMFRALCFMLYAPCSQPMFMLWPTDSALCSMPHASSFLHLPYPMLQSSYGRKTRMIEFCCSVCLVFLDVVFDLFLCFLLHSIAVLVRKKLSISLRSNDFISHNNTIL